MAPDNQKDAISSEKDGGWTRLIPDEQWSVYDSVISLARLRGISFALGGAFAVAAYTGRWRNTKDLDLYILPQDREAMIQVLTQAGLEDYYDHLPYYREWIYRSYRELANGEVIIVDVIWAMANDRAEVDGIWLSNGAQIEVRGKVLQVLPPEELMWAKLYIIEKDRCDWPDILNVFFVLGENIRWEHLLARLGADIALLRGVVSVFSWLAPGRTMDLPEWLWDHLHLPKPQPVDSAEEVMLLRTRLLDTRPWFVPAITQDE